MWMTHTVADNEMTWGFDSGETTSAGGYSFPGAWEMTLTKSGSPASTTASFADCFVMRGPLTYVASPADKAMPATGPVYIGYWFNTETGAVEIKAEATLAEVTDDVFDGDSPIIKRVLYKAVKSASGSWSVAADYRNTPYSGEYV